MPSHCHLTLAAACLLLTACVGSAQAQAATLATPEDAARQYLQAEASFDLAALKAVLDPRFVEISPLGQVDEYDAVLSFYAPQSKIALPAVQVGQFKVRSNGDTAVLDSQLSVSVAGHERRMTVGLVTKQTAQGWKLLSAQYTPVRPNQHPATP